jgi:hypothetical protein
MPTRRKFIQATAAIAMIPAWPAFAAPGRCLSLYRIVYDRRIPAAVVFAAAAQQPNERLAGFDGDVSTIWQRDLYAQWQLSAVPIAGLSNHQAWFFLDMMARDVGMRTLYLAHHDSTTRGNFAHTLFGPHDVQAQRAALQGAQARWPAVAADIVTRFPAEKCTVARANSNIGAMHDRSIASDALVSWIIAPPQRDRKSS